MNSNTEEIQQEIIRLQVRLQMDEDRLRYFEPDPLKFTTMEDFDLCEKNVMQVLNHVMQRKMYRGSPNGNHGFSTSFDNEVWISENSHNPPHTSIGPNTLIPPRDHPITIYDPMWPSTTNNLNMASRLAECPMGNPSDPSLPNWDQAYTSTEFLSTIVPISTTSFPPLQHDILNPDVTGIIPHDLPEIAASTAKESGDGDGYEKDHGEKNVN